MQALAQGVLRRGWVGGARLRIRNPGTIAERPYSRKARHFQGLFHDHSPLFLLAREALQQAWRRHTRRPNESQCRNDFTVLKFYASV